MKGLLNVTEINNLLSSQALGRLGCAIGNHPYIVPITYTYDGQYIYGQSNEGQKLDIMRLNPNVCFEVDQMLSMGTWQCVVILGKFEELQQQEAQRVREILYHLVYSLSTNDIVHGHEHATNTEMDDSYRKKTVMFRIRVDKVSGRYERQ